MSNPLPSTAWKVGGVANGRVCIESLGHIWCLYFREMNTNNVCWLVQTTLVEFPFVLNVLFPLCLLLRVYPAYPKCTYLDRMSFFPNFSKEKIVTSVTSLSPLEKSEYVRREEMFSKVTSSGARVLVAALKGVAGRVNNHHVVIGYGKTFRSRPYPFPCGRKSQFFSAHSARKYVCPGLDTYLAQLYAAPQFCD